MMRSLVIRLSSPVVSVPTLPSPSDENGVGVLPATSQSYELVTVVRLVVREAPQERPAIEAPSGSPESLSLALSERKEST